MLKLGFKEDVEKILKTIKDKTEGKRIQNMLFSATLPRWVRNVAEDYMAPSFKTIDLA